MHGSIFFSFKRFVTDRDGAAGWAAVIQSAGVRGWYLATESYPDEELLLLVQATGAREGRSPVAILEDFGAAILPTLLSMYGAFMKPEWRTLDLLLNTESVMHKAVRLLDLNAAPPRLKARRISASEVELEYNSERRLCAFAIGICRGVAAHYGEAIAVEQPACRETGASACRLVVRLLDRPKVH